MLKLPAIACGVALTLWGAILLNAWLLVPGLAVFGLGLFYFGRDFGVADFTDPPSNPTNLNKE